MLDAEPCGVSLGISLPSTLSLDLYIVLGGRMQRRERGRCDSRDSGSEASGFDMAASRPFFPHHHLIESSRCYNRRSDVIEYVPGNVWYASSMPQTHELCHSAHPFRSSKSAYLGQLQGPAWSPSRWRSTRP